MKKNLTALILFIFLLMLSLQAQLLIFNPTTKIYTIKSEHFEILFPVGYENIAKEAIIMGENRYKVLSDFLNWKPEKKIVIAFYPNYDYSNGLTMVSPYNLIKAITYPPKSNSEINNYKEWLNFLLTHELTHIFHLDQSRDIASFFRTILGNAPTAIVFPQLSNSPAFMEGIAVYSESVNTNGGRLNTSTYLAYIKNNVIFNNFPPFDRVYGGTLFFPGMSSMYIYGSYMVDYIAKTKKWKNIKKAINISSKVPMIYGPELALLVLTDHMPWRHYTLMKNYYKEKYKSLKLNITQLTRTGYWKKYLIKGGKTLFYIEMTPFDMQHIAEYDIKTGKITKILGRYNIETLSFDKKADALYFSAINRVNNYYEFSDIYYYDLNKRKVKRVSKGMRLSYPVSYKNDLLIAVKQELVGSRIILFDKKQKKSVKKFEIFDQISNPVLNDEKTHLYFIGHKNGAWDIYSLELKTGDIQRITGSLSIEKYLLFKDNKIYFVSQSKEEQSLFMYDIDNGKFYKLFTSPTDIRGFAFYEKNLFLLSLYNKGVEIVKPDKIDEIEINDYNDLQEDNKNNENRDNKINEQPKSEIKKANLLKYYIPKFWLPSFKKVDGRYLWGPETFSFDPYMRNQFFGGIYYNPSASKYPSTNLSLIHYLWYLPLFIRYSDTSSKNDILGDYREINLKVGTFYQCGDYYKRLRFSMNYVYESRKKTIYKYDLSGISFDMNYNSTKRYSLSISRENGVLFSAGYRKNLKALGSDFDLNEAYIDLRTYINGAYKNQVLALKFDYYRSWGDGIKIIGVGGEEGSEDYPSIFNPSISLQRAYKPSSFYGNNIYSFSMELRNPIARIERGFKFYPIFISQIYSSIFLDWSKVKWENRGSYNLLSIGVELSIDVRIQYFLNLTLTGGVAFPSSGSEPVKPRYYFRIGKSF